MGAPSPTKRSISDIKDKILQPALTSHFECYFPLPPGEGFSKFLSFGKFPSTNLLTEKLILSCSEASLPGSSLATHELNNDFTGVTQRHAYRRLYDDRADFTFYVDTEYTQIRFFETWLRFITNEQNAGSDKLNLNYRVKYPKDYKTTIYISKFEKDLGIEQASQHAKTGTNKTSKSSKVVYSFFNAFPISINSMPVSYDSSQLLKCTVSFTYDRYILSDVSIAGIQGEPSQSSAVGSPSVVQNAFTGNASITGGNYFNTAVNQNNRQFNIGAGTQAELNQINSNSGLA